MDTDGPASYTYAVPMDEGPGTYSEILTVTDAVGNKLPMTVNIEVTPKLTVSPETMDLHGTPGNYAKGGISISGGRPPYTITVEDSSATVKPNVLTGAGNTTFYYFIDGDNPEEPEDPVVVTVTDGSETATVEITIKIAENTKPLSEIAVLSESDIPLARDLEEIAFDYDVDRELEELTAEESELIDITNALIDTAMGDTNRGASHQTDLASALAKINPKNVTSTFDMSFLAAVNQAHNIDRRLLALRNGTPGFSARGLALKLDGQAIPDSLQRAFLFSDQTGGAAGADAPSDSRLGVFVIGDVNIGDKDGTSAESGFDFDSAGITAGIDYLFTRNLALGAALGFVATGFDFYDDAGELSMNGWSVSLYGTWWMTDSFYVDGAAFGEWNDYNSKRRIVFTLPNLDIDRTAKGDYDGAEYSIDIGAGCEFEFNAFTFDIFGGLMYSKFRSDGFEETGAGGLDMVIDEMDAQFLTFTLGARAHYAIKTSMGVLSPNLLFEWKNEFEDQGGSISAGFVHDLDPSRRFEIPTDKLDSVYFRWGLGASMVFPRGNSAYIHYTTTDLNSVTNHNISFGGRIEF
ncbi:MAG: autotransporter outer membrane beta-barrel domain-containing protein [Desulfobacterales bacterium]|nr:autotransporter outer membrane beta-barrel domain-containing protein [Desulfobacterales bacterium]